MKKILHIISIIFILLACDTDNKNYKTLVGGWKCTELNTETLNSYIIEIDRKVQSDTIYIISNFHNLGHDIFVNIYSSNFNITIPKQWVNDIFLYGSGTISNDYSELKIEYVLEEGAFNQIEAVYKRN
jgi:hypothetical protein